MKSRVDLVKKKDRYTHQDIISELNHVIQTANEVKDAEKEIRAIFEKIRKWKDSFGDLEQQETLIKNKFSNKDAKLSVHNVRTLWALLKTISGEIGLTDKELHLIVFTSLNMNYFTNLIMTAGQFSLWFTMNFQGESQEEKDFLENKLEMWDCVIFQALKVTMEYGKLDAKKQPTIMSQQWWERMRYRRFGDECAKQLNANPQLKAEIREIFKSHQDKLCYYDFSQFTQKKLKLQLKNWEEEDLESRLDQLGMAFIEFNEFNEFMLEFGLDFGEPVIA